MIETLRQWIDSSNYIVFFGGAGVSTDSGIADFRGENGLYYQEYDIDPARILSLSFFEKNPEEFFYFYREKMMPVGYKPNVTHYKLAQMEQEGKIKAIITQNIDGLHQLAGSKNVLELHGTMRSNLCLECGREYSAEYVYNSVGIPRCVCTGILKPEVVLYEERLNPDVMYRAMSAIYDADLLIVGGTSLSVRPAADMLDYYKGSKLVVINRDPTPVDDRADLVFRCGLGEVFSQL